MRKNTIFGAIVSVLLLTAGLFVAGPAAAAANDVCGVNLVTGHTACRTSDAGLAAWATDDSAAGTAASVSPQSSFLIGKIWEDKNKSGAVYEWFTSGPCDGNHSTVDWEYGVLNDIGWNNKISSFQGYSNCYIKLYENINYNINAAGSTYGPYSSTNYVGDVRFPRNREGFVMPLPVG